MTYRIIYTLLFLLGLYLLGWLVSLIHEFGHYVIGKCLGINSSIHFTISNHGLPVGKVKFKLNRKFTKKEDLLISIAGVIAAETTLLLGIIIFHKNVFAVELLMILIPKYIFSLIPVQGNDGLYILKALINNEEVLSKNKRRLYGFVVFITTAIFIGCIFIGLRFMSLSDTTTYVILLTGTIYYTTYIRYLIKLKPYLEEEVKHDRECKVYCQ